MTGRFLIYLVFPLTFYYSIIMMTSLVFFPRKHCSLPTTLEMGKLNNYRLLHHACLSSSKVRTSQVDPPLALQLFFTLPRVRTSSKSHAAPLSLRLKWKTWATKTWPQYAIESDFETELQSLKSADEVPITGEIRLKLRLEELYT